MRKLHHRGSCWLGTALLLMFAASVIQAQGVRLPDPVLPAPGPTPVAGEGGRLVAPPRVGGAGGVGVGPTTQVGGHALAQPGVTTDGGSDRVHIRFLQGQSVQDRMDRLSALAINPVDPTASSNGGAGGDAERDTNVTAPAFEIRKLKSCADEPVEPVGDPSVSLRKAHLTADVWNNVAVCTLELQWVNATTRNQQVTYYLPLARTAMITGLQLSIASSMEEGTHEDLTEATQTYEDIVRRSLDPALLEAYRTDVARLRVFPVEPGKVKRVRIQWVELLEYVNGSLAFEFPTHLHQALHYRLGEFSATMRLVGGSDRLLRATALGRSKGTSGGSTLRVSPTLMSRVKDPVAASFALRDSATSFSDVLPFVDADGKGYFLATRFEADRTGNRALSPAEAAAASRRNRHQAAGVSFTGDDIKLAGAATEDVCARRWDDANGGCWTLYVGRATGLAARQVAANLNPAARALEGMRRMAEPIWAGSQMESLSEELTTTDAEKAATIEELGRSHRVMTPFSALLVLEPGMRRP